MALKPEFVALLQNNDIPSESTIRELTESLKAPLNELREIDIEIQRLRELVENLKIKRRSIQEIVDDHNTILSPIRRLPLDVLHEIFFYCLPTHRNPIMKASEAPVLLTRICSSWRAIALSSPRIWSKIHIPLTGDPSFSPEYGMVRDEAILNTRHQLFTGVLQRRCDVVRRWLSRSGTCPLSISITHPGSILDTPTPEEKEMFSILLSLADRWSDVDISLPGNLHHTLQANIQPSMFPSLNSLKVNVTREVHLNHIQRPPIELLAAPGLRRITIRATETMTLHSDLLLRLVWNRLTHITFDSSITDAYFLFLLKRCPNLVFGHFVISAPPWGDVPNTHQVDQEDVVLPCLESLEINDAGLHGIMSITFKAIRAPALTRLSYHWYNSRSYGDDASIPLPAPVIPLLSNSTLLSNLLLSGELSSQDIKEILRCGERVTHIVFDKPPASNFSSRDSPLMDPYVARPDVFDLKLLSANSSSETPLPRLESLEAHLIASFTDEDVLDLIRSRINAFKRGEATAFKSVKIYFRRRKQNDITEEVSRLSMEAGFEVKLDLIYAPESSTFYDHLSPSFGLSFNDRMWSSEIIA